MSVKHLRRPRIQRAFMHWFNENHTRFAIPIRVTKITAKGVELRFQNYPDCLSVVLSSDELAVHVEWLGERWDRIIDLDVWAYHTRGGYKCRCCWDERGESAEIFPNLEALWQDHLFNPFLKWVNEKLAPARWLRISCTSDRGSTWAKFIRDESELGKPDRTLLFLQ